jgi:hypothetical protein
VLALELVVMELALRLVLQGRVKVKWVQVGFMVSILCWSKLTHQVMVNPLERDTMSNMNLILH